MRNHKHYGTPQDTSFIGDIVRCIAEHGGLRDWEKDLLINRITAPIDEPESPEVLRAKEGISKPAAHEPADMPTPNGATSAEVARTPDTAAPLPMTITNDDGSFFIAIGDRKWKICRPGIIGINEKDRWEFNDAACKLSGCELPWTTDIESTLPYSRQSYLEGKAGEYKKLLAARGTADTSLGQIAYECFRASGEVLGAESAPPWSDIPKDGPVCAAWEFLGRACYYSVGTWPDDTEKTIQMLATRKRLQLLRETGRFQVKEGTEFASFLNLVAGPPVERKA